MSMVGSPVGEVYRSGRGSATARDDAPAPREGDAPGRPPRYNGAVETPSQPPLTPDLPRGSHPAPPADARPRSRLAMWSLVLSVVLSLACFVTGLLWILLIPAALLAAWAIVRVRPEALRGQGMAIGALVLSLLMGSCFYMGARTIGDTSRALARGVLGGLTSESDPGRLAGWLTKEARDAGAEERLRARYAATVEALGPYANELLEETPWLGAQPYVAPPRGVQELGAGTNDAYAPGEAAFWVRARFRDGVAHVRIHLGRDDAEALQRIITGATGAEGPAVVDDVRFFRGR